MKKLVVLLVAFLIFVTPVISYASSYDNLKAIDAVPEGFTEENLGEAVTRAEFSYMTAKLLNCGKLSPVNTRFADVTEENIYSGYIEHLAGVGVLSGTQGAIFNPDAPADINMVNKILVCALGYGSLAAQLGGYPDGYNIVADELGFHKDIVIGQNGYVTKSSAAIIIENALLSEIPSMQIVAADGKLSVYPDGKAKKRILCDVLGYSAYTGVFTKVNYEENTAVFTVNANKYSQNKNMLSIGSEYVFEAIDTINSAEVEQLPVTIWVNDNEEVINIIPAKNTEVKYGYIEKVNGNSRNDANYPAVNIEDITMVGQEEYDVAENLTLKYNGEVTQLPVKLCGRFARLVVVNDEVIFVESWDIEEGGLITNIDYEISYTQGDEQGHKISDILTKKSIRVFIDNKPANYKDLRANSVFDYYETDESLVIVASEEIYSEKLERYSAFSSLEIGNLVCKADGKIYCSLDGKVFKENANIDKLLGETVYVYFAPNGYAKYIVNAENVMNKDTFYGIVSGVQSDIFNETAEIELYKVKGTSIEKGIYSIDSDKLKAGVTIEELKNNAKSISKNILYKFDVNSDNKILSITKPEAFYGLEANNEFLIGGWVSDSSSYFTVDGVRVYLDAAAPITYIYKDEDGFSVSSITWNTIKGRNANGAKISFYGSEMTAYPEFILMCGGPSGIYKSTAIYGIYTGYTEGINGEGEVCKIARIITNAGLKDFYVDDETIRGMEADTGGAGLVKIYTEHSYSDSGNEISYDSTVCKLSTSSEYWETTETINANGLHEGTVKAVAGNRVYFDDGTAYYMTHESAYKSVVSFNDNAPGQKFKKIELSELTPGDKVYYYMESGAIYSIILSK